MELMKKRFRSLLLLTGIVLAVVAIRAPEPDADPPFEDEIAFYDQAFQADVDQVALHKEIPIITCLNRAYDVEKQNLIQAVTFSNIPKIPDLEDGYRNARDGLNCHPGFYSITTSRIDIQSLKLKESRPGANLERPRKFLSASSSQLEHIS